MSTPSNASARLCTPRLDMPLPWPARPKNYVGAAPGRNPSICAWSTMSSLEQRCPLVTVVLVTYNHERFIAQSIDGVLMQQAPFPFELVVVEDSSTDGTRGILAEYQRRFPDKIHLRLAASNQNNNRAWAKPLLAREENMSRSWTATITGRALESCSCRCVSWRHIRNVPSASTTL